MRFDLTLNWRDLGNRLFMIDTEPSFPYYAFLEEEVVMTGSVCFSGFL
jgi:hypothetical protein